MTGDQCFNFHFYRDGISPVELRLGNIVWDFKKPSHGRPYIHADDISTDHELCDDQKHVPLDVTFTDPKTFAASVGFENVIEFGAQYGDNMKTHISSELAERINIFGSKHDEFKTLICKDERARDWLHKNLSAAFTVATIKNLFLRPKLWLCTGIVSIEKGSFEVTYEGSMGLHTTFADPTNTIPIDGKLEMSREPASTRITGITQRRVIAAQWMLLYCRYVSHTNDPALADYVKLRTRYAKGNVKGISEPLVWISANAKGAMQAEKQGHDLFVTLAEDEPISGIERNGKHVNEDMLELMQPMFPEEGTEGYETFEKYLSKLSGRTDQGKIHSMN